MNLLLIIALSIAVKGVSFTPMEVERLPQLNIPREASGLVLAGGEFTVFGGQTWGVEVYHPATHSFSYLPILDHKRTHATALEIEGTIHKY